jgi:hypothetical protein
MKIVWIFFILLLILILVLILVKKRENYLADYWKYQYCRCKDFNIELDKLDKK